MSCGFGPACNKLSAFCLIGHGKDEAVVFCGGMVESRGIPVFFN